MSVISAGWLTMMAPLPPRLPAHCLQYKCSPFVSVDQMSQRLLCWSASLLIRSELNERSLDPVLPALSLYLHSLRVHARVENPVVYQTFFIVVMNISTVLMWHTTSCQPILFSVFCSIGYRPFLKNTLTFFIAIIKGLSAWFSVSTIY